MYLFNPKRFKGSLSLTEKDMTLLQLICRFVFVNDSQLDMLYSVVQHYPTRFFHPITKIDSIFRFASKTKETTYFY